LIIGDHRINFSHSTTICSFKIMDRIEERSPLGQRITQISQQVGISDFYITPWEPLVYKQNGKLIYDSFVYHPETNIPVVPGSIDYGMSFGGMRFRVNRMVTRGRYRWVLRLLPSRILHPQEICLPPQSIKAYMEARNGLFLICGATGSGKTTTIASMIKYRAERKQEHVVTFEDPIEFLYPDGMPSLISQREIGEDALDFGQSLRASLRQAPDVIFVGEIRDGETAEIALQAAETGHVVVATLHTNSAAQTVQRFLKLIPSDRLESAQASLADTLRMVMCQRLLFDERRNCRFGIHEILLQYDSVTNLIRRGEFKKLEQELETGAKRGMMSFERSIEARIGEGWYYNVPAPSGFTPDEVDDFMQAELPAR
jgi:twitching motility protein PilT